MSPVGPPAPLRTLIDIDLAQFNEVWAAGGHPHYVFPTTFDELVRISGGTPADVGARPGRPRPRGAGRPDTMTHVNAPATVRQLATARDWLEATEAMRAAHPVIMNLSGSVAESVAAGTRYDGELWLVVEEAGAVVGCAIRTAPHPALLSPMNEEAASAVGVWLAEHESGLSSLSGPVESVDRVAAAMGRVADIRMREVIRVLGTLRAPAPCDGLARAATPDDMDMLRRWFVDFHTEAGLVVVPSDDRIRSSIDEGRLFVWETDVPVAMAGHSTIVAIPGGRVGRIGPVYTLPQHRRRGYGAAATHTVASLLSARCNQVMLFADARNPGSNRVYERLGFAVVAEFVEADLHEL